MRSDIRRSVLGWAVVGLLASQGVALGQGWKALVDFGVATTPTAAAPRVWNNLDPANQTTPLALVDDAGGATGVLASIPSGMHFVGANSAGPTVPAPGSALEALGYPASAIGDVMYGSSARPRVELALSGLDPTKAYDVTLFGGRMGVGDARDTSYELCGFQAQAGSLAVSNNDADVVTLVGMVPDAAGTLTLGVEAAPTNTSSSGYYYLATLELEERAGLAPPVLGFDPSRLWVRRGLGAPVFATSVSLRASSAAPMVALSAVDPATMQAPAWLNLPAQAQSGSSVALTFDTAGLTPGTHRADVVATAAGYGSTRLAVVLDVPVPGTLQILQYGNSYTISNGGLPRLLTLMADELGPAPVDIVARLRGGTTLGFHRFDPGHAGAITTALPIGGQWDFVVMQGHSLQTTAALGNLAEFLDDALAIHTAVRAHSPAARAVLFQTWARAQGHGYYPNTMASPAAMHHEVRRAYTQATQRSVQAFGPGAAVRAAVGDAVALTGWDPAYYTPDLSHPEPILTLMEAMVLHTAIHQVPLCGAEPDFAGGSPLVTVLAGMGLGAAEWRQVAVLADRVASPSLRTEPGSSDDLLLATSAGGFDTVCGLGEVRAGDALRWTLTSPGGAYDNAFAVVGVDLRPVGAPGLAFPGIGAVHLDPLTAFALDSGFLGAAGFNGQVTVPASLPGVRVLVQGIAAGASVVTGQPLTATDGHRLVFR